MDAVAMTLGGMSARAIAGRWTTTAHTHHLRTGQLYTLRARGAGGRAQIVRSRGHDLRPAPCALPPPCYRSRCAGTPLEAPRAPAPQRRAARRPPGGGEPA